MPQGLAEFFPQLSRFPPAAKAKPQEARRMPGVLLGDLGDPLHASRGPSLGRPEDEDSDAESRDKRTKSNSARPKLSGSTSTNPGPGCFRDQKNMVTRQGGEPWVGSLDGAHRGAAGNVTRADQRTFLEQNFPQRLTSCWTRSGYLLEDNCFPEKEKEGYSVSTVLWEYSLGDPGIFFIRCIYTSKWNQYLRYSKLPRGMFQGSPPSPALRRSAPETGAQKPAP